MPTTNYIWDELDDNLLLEVDDVGNVTVEYENEPSRHRASNSQTRDGATFYFHYDRDGSTRSLSGEDESETDTITFTAYGESVTRSGATETLYQFQGAHGYQTDGELETIYIRRRTYCPSAGRWSSRDPLEFVNGPNTYRAYFVPNGSDPSGQDVLDLGPDDYSKNLDWYCDHPSCLATLKRFEMPILCWAGPPIGPDQGINSSVLHRLAYFGYTLIEGAENRCGLVNFIKGRISHSETGRYSNVREHHGRRQVPAHWPDWTVDTTDTDPEYDSMKLTSLHNPEVGRYQPVSSNTYWTSDEPNVFREYSMFLSFKMCILEKDHIPQHVDNIDPSVLMGRAIKCIDWDAYAYWRSPYWREPRSPYPYIRARAPRPGKFDAFNGW